MSGTTIVYGPQGCGKTLAAQAMARAMGLTQVVDEWQPGQALQPGALHLTNVDLSKSPVRAEARVLAFSEWQQTAGV